MAGSAAVTVAQSEPLPQIRVAVWSGPEADNLRKVVEAYTAETGNPVEIDEIARDGYDAALRTSIVGGGSDWDVVYSSADWLPAFIAAGGLAPIDEYIASMPADFLNVADLEPGISNLTFDGQVYGFPSEGDTAWLFYRTDLLEAAGIEPPQTMDEMLAAAQALTTPERYGLVIGSRTDEAWWDFMHYFWAFGGQLFDPETMEVTVNDEAGVAALTFYSDLLQKHAVVSPDVTTYGFNEILTALGPGQGRHGRRVDGRHAGADRLRAVTARLRQARLRAHPAVRGRRVRLRRQLVGLGHPGHGAARRKPATSSSSGWSADRAPSSGR